MTVKYLAAVLALAILSPAVLAESIGINFVGLNAGESTLAKAATAGAPAVAQAHWNNMTIDASDPNGSSNGGTMLEVSDDQGNPAHGVTVQASGDEQHKLWPANGEPWGFTGHPLTLQRGMVQVSPLVTVADIPYEKYDIYVYVSAGGNGGIGKATVSVANDVDGTVSSTPTRFINYGWTNGSYVESTATSEEKASEGQAATYIVFPGNTASDFTLEFIGNVKKGWMGLAGIQIVKAE